MTVGLRKNVSEPVWLIVPRLTSEPPGVGEPVVAASEGQASRRVDRHFARIGQGIEVKVQTAAGPVRRPGERDRAPDVECAAA